MRICHYCRQPEENYYPLDLIGKRTCDRGSCMKLASLDLSAAWWTAHVGMPLSDERDQRMTALKEQHGVLIKMRADKEKLYSNRARTTSPVAFAEWDQA